MTPSDFDRGVEAVRRAYRDTRVLPAGGSTRPLRVAPVYIPTAYWGGGSTRLLVVFDLATHDSNRPRGLLGPEWKLPTGAAPMNAQPVYEFGEAWQAFSWSFPWPPALGVVETVEAYLGRFHDQR
jgi:hypothetical protein